MRHFILTLVVVVACAAFSNRAQAQGPVAAVEPIDITLAPNQPLELFFPNVFDPNHPKFLHFVGTATSQTTATLDVGFDWFDLTGQKQVVFTQIPDVIIPGVPTHIERRFMIPFCPERVSLDLIAQGSEVHLVGEFFHECRNVVVPLPAAAWAGLALMGAMGLRRVMRRKAA